MSSSLFALAMICASAALAADTQPPICVSSITGSGVTGIVDGSATDRGGDQTGIVSVVLDSSSLNLLCTGCTPTPLARPVGRVAFSLSLLDTGTPSGRGFVNVTDGAGNVCHVGVGYTPVAQGPVTDLPLLVNTTLGSKLYVLKGASTANGEAIAAFHHPPNPDDVACLPGCFSFLPNSLMVTVDSPITGFAQVAYDIDSGSDSRLLFRHPTDACPFLDKSASIRSLVFDPRLKSPGDFPSGGISFSRVQFSMASQIAGCSPSKKVDLDKDGFFFGGSTPAASADCNDANAGIHPGAAEACNGVDDNCDSVVDGGSCGTIQLEAVLNTTGSGQTTSTVPMVGAEVRLYDSSPGSCADRLGATPKKYCKIFGEGPLSGNPGCVAETSGATDDQGKVSFSVPPGTYLAIARPAPPNQDKRPGVNSVTVEAGGSAQKRIVLNVDTDGNEVPSRTCE